MRLTCAGARVQLGILFSSVSIENKSSAEAMNPASTVIVAVLTALAGVFAAGLGAAAGDAADDEEVAGAAEPGAGVPLRLGSALTVRSLPWVLMIAAGNSDSLACNTAGSFDLARLYTFSTAGLRSVVRDHSHYIPNVIRDSSRRRIAVRHTT